MKLHTIASLVVSGLCLASAGTLRADNVSLTPPDPSKHHHYDNPAGDEAIYGAEDATGGTGSTASESKGQSAEDINRVQSVIGMEVNNRQGQHLGEVKDVVIDQESGKVSFALVEKAEHAKGTPKKIAVPVRDFRSSSDMKSLVLDVEKEVVVQAR